MATIEYVKFSFNKPELISAEEFEVLKSVNGINDFVKRQAVVKMRIAFLLELFGLLISGILILIGHIIDISDGPESLSLIFIVPGFFILLFLFLRLMKSVPSYLTYRYEHYSYYKNLKKKFDKSESYDDFLVQYGKSNKHKY